MSKWSKPQVTDGITRAFGGNMKDLLPPMIDIPVEFQNEWKWHKIQSTWFAFGLPKDTVFKPKEGIDTNTALGHLRAIQGSFEPKHEHKVETVSWLMSLWFEDIIVNEESLKQSVKNILKL